MTSKICSCCGKEKPLSDFYTDRTHNDGYSSRGRECKRIAARKSYKADPKSYHKRNKAYRDMHKQQIAARMKAYSEVNAEQLAIKRNEKYSKRAVVVESLKTPCAKCGDKRLYVIDFHHVNPAEKTCAISISRSEQTIKAEAKKCICLCRNCHQEFHYFYGKHPEDPVKALKEYLGSEEII